MILSSVAVKPPTSGGGYKAIEDKNILSDIRNMLESLNIQSAEFLADYKDSKGRTV